MAIPFIQYMRPNGRAKQITIERSDSIELLAQHVMSKGARFEIEQLMNGAVSMTCAYKDEDIEIELCSNGPEVPVAVDRLVTNAAKHLGLEVKDGNETS